MGTARRAPTTAIGDATATANRTVRFRCGGVLLKIGCEATDGKRAAYQNPVTVIGMELFVVVPLPSSP